MSEREWQTDPVKKFGDVSSARERAERDLPAPKGFTPKPTPEIQMRREVDQQFTIKKK